MLMIISNIVSNLQRQSKLHLVLILSSSMLLSACNNADATNKEEDSVEVIAIPVEVASVVKGDISSHYSTTTVIEAKHDAQVISKAGGIIDAAAAVGEPSGISVNHCVVVDVKGLKTNTV